MSPPHSRVLHVKQKVGHLFYFNNLDVINDSNGGNKPTRQEAMLQHLCGQVPKGKVNVVTCKTEVVKPFSKSFGQVPKCKVEDDTVGPPAKRRVAELCINHSAIKSLPVLFGRVPKHKAEGDAARLPPKRRVVKSSSITHDMPQECHLWWLPNELLSDIADLLDADSLWKLSQVSKLLQGISSHCYLATVGFKLPISSAYIMVHIFMNIRQAAVSTLLESIQHSGCTKLHVYPSPSSLTSLVSLNISLPIFFFPHSIQFTLSALQIVPLKSLQLNNMGLSPVQWAAFLHKVNLHCLTELEVD
ncbi:hypothetical protein EDD16DRAFT_1522723 [Pisolithus croceorrhizus]|nr:hypothetical protein EV401DRAFT_1895906 [Pisolithus croceorrhizus]KAI6109019.1 hypothetical protein EDD16DRAFT_1522723 [Pisolithus croceorrhizus]KAI6141564.1 hypothetical protein EDD17DRAFT_1516002 [Pisolithus thermaeus]